jgi:DUF1365 family protein
MHVSPFNGMDQAYAFSLSEPGRRLSVSITDSNPIRLFMTHPCSPSR